jgi:ABC-type transporter Mla subunit MlaD
MPTQPVPQTTRDELLAAIQGLQRKAMKPGIPIPQMIALKNRAQELFDQLIELDAAEFNEGTADYAAATETLNGTIKDLRENIRDIDDIIENLEKVAAVFKALDGLLKVAAKFAPIG